MSIFYQNQRDIQDLTIENIAIERLESLLDKYDDVPRVLQAYIRKEILPDLWRLTQFMRDPYISRIFTTNPVENYYSQTDPEEIKKRYKTTE